MSKELGQILQQERKRQHIDFEDVLGELHIQRHYLTAIESGNLQEIAGTGYQTAYIRSYAEFLGLDADECIALLEAPVPLNKQFEHVPIITIEDVQKPSKFLLVLSLFLTILTYIIMSRFDT